MREVKLRCIYVIIESVDSSDQLKSHNDYSRTFSNDTAGFTRGEGEVCAALPELSEGNIVHVKLTDSGAL